MKRVDFYFDYLSPFAYFAALALPDLCRERDARLHYHPVLFAGLLNHWGQLGPAEVAPKALNVFKQCARYAALHEIPFRGPRFHPFLPLAALRVSLPSVAGERQTRVVEAIFRAGWGDGVDLGSPEVLGRALDAAGLDGSSLMARAAEPHVKQALRDSTDTAIARGVFGIPTMCCDEELFWGIDQLPYLALYLEGRDPLATIDLASIATEGQAAVRPGSKR
jgi:2-hydroxychromene-2-carboxylate isomerase